MVAEPQLIEVARDVFAWIGVDGDSNAGAIRTPQGLVVIDAQQHLRLANKFKAALADRIGEPIRMLVNTHCHLDHTAGNVVFANFPILAHARTLDALESSLGPRQTTPWHIADDEQKAKLLFGNNLFELVPDNDPAQDWFRHRVAGPDYASILIAPPTETFADTFEFVLPNDVIRLAYRGPAHCDGDITVHVIGRKVIFSSDLLFVQRFPWMGDCDLNGWIDRLGEVLRLDVDVVIPGHGPPTNLGEVRRLRDLFMDLRSAVEAAMRAGATEAAAMAEVRLPQCANLPRYDEWIAINVKRTFRYLRG